MAKVVNIINSIKKDPVFIKSTLDDLMALYETKPKQLENTDFEETSLEVWVELGLFKINDVSIDINYDLKFGSTSPMKKFEYTG